MTARSEGRPPHLTCTIRKLSTVSIKQRRLRPMLAWVRRGSFQLTAFAVTLSAIGTAWMVQPTPPGMGQLSHANWRTVYEDARTMARDVEQIVLARAVTSVPGRVASSRTPDGD